MKKYVRRSLFFLMVLVCFFSSISAQNSEKKGWAQGFFGGGISHSDYGSDEFVHAGAGGGILVAGGLGAEAEIGFMHFPGTTSNGTLFSAGAIYAFSSDKRTMPFLTGGYVGFVGDGIASGAYFGGGIMHFLGDHLGVRLEGRDQIYFDDWGGDYHYLEARGAIVLAWD